MITAPDLTPIDDLAPKVLHGIATDEERKALALLLQASPENRQRFIEHSSLHSHLSQLAKAGSFSENPSDHFLSLETPTQPQTKRYLKLWLAPFAAAIAACLILMSILPMTASAALDRVISASKRNIDRSFRIETIPPTSPSPPQRSDRGRFPPNLYLHQATLWLRHPGQFVLRQTLPNEEIRFLGCNGNQSWSKRGDHPAEISSNPERFGGGVLAKHREFAFIDPYEQLPELSSAYTLTWIDRSSTSLWKLRASRQSTTSGGAKEIDLWFNPQSGELQRMILHQLPRDQGGPSEVSITLESTSSLPSDFFNPNFPHTP